SAPARRMNGARADSSRLLPGLALLFRRSWPLICYHWACGRALAEKCLSGAGLLCYGGKRAGCESAPNPQRLAMESLAQAAAMPSASAEQERRIRELRRAFQRVLKRRPTVIERTAMERAARLTARAEAAALDPAVTLDDLVRIDNLAARARARLGD